ncbi:uncharacterized protein LOC115996632 [Ipomoea triloba]|uniref:uncharacterized protein LOC115996632 n=1 Tax=Ipomoea triloba TaxID=35885 RepID=UPI00125D9983|nr:uncharacterized protein LOC115996632 [Ipomoea triloba]
MDCCWCWDKQSGYDLFPGEQPHPFSLPSPLPQWPQGNGFATGRICLGEIEVVQISQFEKIWSCKALFGKSNSVTFYQPVDVPQGFSVLGHYCQLDDKQLSGYVLAARDLGSLQASENCVQESGSSDLPALEKPLSYTLVWTMDAGCNGSGYVWLPNAPDGYKPVGFLVTLEPDEPDLEEIRCVRSDLTESTEACDMIFSTTKSILSKNQFQVWTTRPCKRGMLCRGVSVGTFFCATNFSSGDDLNIACLKNLDSSLHAMPNLNQVHALIKQYGPTVYFHPDEVYLPSSVPWFFENGSLLYKDGKDIGVAIESTGSNLPAGGKNDRKFWIDLPDGDKLKNYVKCGNIDSAELYVHVKPASGGTFTDIVMWVFCPFNGPATLKIGLMSYEMNRIGEHVSDWEHYTLRISNFSGELWSVYFSEHSGGEWLPACNLEFIDGNKPIVYSSRNGHASFPHPGCYLQGSSVLGIGLRNDCAESKYTVDSSTRYQIIAAEYLGEGVVAEPPWLQFMREWGPTIEYDSASEVDKIINHLPFFVRFSVESLFELFPTELYGEEGPTGPKEKDNWLGDER